QRPATRAASTRARRLLPCGRPRSPRSEPIRAAARATAPARRSSRRSTTGGRHRSSAAARSSSARSAAEERCRDRRSWPSCRGRTRPSRHRPRSMRGEQARRSPGRRRAHARRRAYSRVMATTDRRETDSEIEVKPVYTDEDAPAELELPGEFPFTRGPYQDMYRGRPWTIRQYAGFASAEETNRRFRYLLERGQTGLSVAFGLPTQLGYDADDPRATGEVGRTGVAIDSIADTELLFDGIPLDEVSTSMTINAPASLLLLLYELVAEEQGVPGEALRGTVQNDILKEYIARGNYIFPPRPSMRLTTDLFAYCAERIPRWTTISISGYHIAEAGSTAEHS